VTNWKIGLLASAINLHSLSFIFHSVFLALCTQRQANNCLQHSHKKGMANMQPNNYAGRAQSSK